MVKYSVVSIFSVLLGSLVTYNNLTPQIIATNKTLENGNTDVSTKTIVNKANTTHSAYNQSDVDPFKLINFVQIAKIGTGFKQGLAAHNLANTMNFNQLSESLTMLFDLEKNDPKIKLSQIVRQKMLLIDPLSTAELYYAYFNLNLEPLDKSAPRTFRGILHDWALIDIKSALLFVKDNFHLKQQEYYFSYLLKDNHFKQSDYLFAQAELFSPAMQQKILRAKLDSMDPELAFEKLLALTMPSRERYYMFRTAIKKWQSSSADKYLSLQSMLISSNLGNREKERLINEVFIQWADSDPESALAAVSQVKHGKHTTYITSIMSELAKKDGENAVLIAQSFSEQFGNEVIDTAISEWTNYDPQAATLYIEKNGLTKNQSLLNKVAQTYGRKYPKEALQWADNINAPKSIFLNISRSLIRSSPEAAQTYLDSVINQKAKSAMLSALIYEKSRYNIEEANTWLNQYSEYPDFKDAQQTLFHNWSRQNPKQAALALNEVTDIVQLENLIPSIASQWYKKDAMATESWIKQLDNNKAKDLALFRIIIQEAPSDFEHAKMLLSQIQDNKVAQRARKTLSHFEKNKGN